VARPLRQELPGGLFHVYGRGNNGRRIFLDDRDRQLYLELLARTVRWRKWRCLSYCLMDTHMHLLVETPDANLAAGMQQLHGTYGRRFNDRYDTRGHLFESRYGSVLITSDLQLMAVVRYLALNPVNAGMCRRPEEYEWSSYARTRAGDPPGFVSLDRLYWHLSGLGGDPATTYANLIADALWT
jgi:REP element-mobilizing transposase RayT